MKILLVTGFAPFGGEKTNPSYVCASSLPDEICGVRIEKRELPVSWANTETELTALLSELRPDAVLLLGQAGGRPNLTIERVAVNLREAASPDNDGVTENEGRPVIEGAPDAYFSTLPYRAMLAACKQNGIPTAFSYSAGCYLCNCSMFTARHFAAQNGLHMPAGFIHVPYLPEQVDDKPSMGLETLRKGILLCAEEIAKML